jgi:hypothetical protein
MNAYQRTAIAAAIAACFPAVAGANVASVDFAVGNVTATGSDGRSRQLTKGSQIEVGETVATQNGRAQLRFSDGAYMSLQPQTEFKVEQFQYSGKEDAKDSIVMNLLKGGMRTITGLIGRTNRNNYKLRTEVATIGIRGTEYSVQYTNSIELFCAGGAITVENQSGTFLVPSGQGVMVQNQNTAPKNTQGAPVLSPNSTTQQQQEEEEQASNEPTNPVQESTTPDSVTTQLAAAQKKLFAGTYTGHGAISVGTSIVIVELNQQGTFDAAGGLTAFTSSTLGGTLASGTSTVTSQGNDSIIAWGRWTNGMTSGVTTTFDTTANPLHYVVGLPVTNMPASGTATYSMIGATTPSTNFTSAQVNASTLSVDFASSSASFMLRMGINQTATNLDVTVPLVRNGEKMSGSTTSFTQQPGFLCIPTINAQGFLSGDAAARAGMAYRIFDGCCTTGRINGAIAFKKD